MYGKFTMMMTWGEYCARAGVGSGRVMRWTRQAAGNDDADGEHSSATSSIQVWAVGPALLCGILFLALAISR
jgi:hypothetical protein